VRPPSARHFLETALGSERRRWHADDLPQADASVAPVGFVFDLRQQLDFGRARAANHGGGLGTLSDGREEEP
jgi:hypothetical protein